MGTDSKKKSDKKSFLKDQIDKFESANVKAGNPSFKSYPKHLTEGPWKLSSYICLAIINLALVWILP